MQTHSESGIQNNQSWVKTSARLYNANVVLAELQVTPVQKSHRFSFCTHVFSRDPFMILSGGLSYDTVGRRACLTVMHGKSTAVLEMDYPIVDFLTLCETPYPNGNPLLL